MARDDAPGRRYETSRLPVLSTFLLATWHEEVRDTAVGQHCLGFEEEEDIRRLDLAAIARDVGWRPSLPFRVSIWCAASIVALPYEMQQSLFEEGILLFWAMITAAAFHLVGAVDVFDSFGVAVLGYALTCLILVGILAACNALFNLALRSVARSYEAAAKPVAPITRADRRRSLARRLKAKTKVIAALSKKPAASREPAIELTDVYAAKDATARAFRSTRLKGRPSE